MTWDDNDLNGAHFIARPSNNKSAITFYPGNNYHAVYIANMTEYIESYFGSTQDIQFLYNAITYKPVPLYLPVVIKVD